MLPRHAVIAAAVLVACVGPAVAVWASTPIGPNDVLYIEVYRHPNLSASVQVDEDGGINIPSVGIVAVGGLSEAEASERVQQAFQRILRNPSVTVSRSGAIPSSAEGGRRTVEMKTEMLPLSNANAETVTEAIHGMTTPGGAIGFDPNTNTLIITDTPETIANIMNVVSRLDRMDNQLIQVRIESKIAEVRAGAMKELGVKWWVQGDDAGGGFAGVPTQSSGLQALKGTRDPFANQIVGGPGAGNDNATGRRYVDEPQFDRRLALPVNVPVPGQVFLGFMNQSVDIGMLLDALVADNKAKLLANPMILAVNHQPAEIKMADEVPYTEFGIEVSGRTNFTTKFMDLGIKLNVTPHVYRDEQGQYIKLELEPEVSYANGTVNGVPVRSVRSSKSTANVRDGQTLVIGGITQTDQQNVEQQVPGLGKVPLVGNLFKHKEQTKVRTELMVFVTPRIHAAPESITWDQMIAGEGFDSSLELIPKMQSEEEKRRN